MKCIIKKIMLFTLFLIFLLVVFAQNIIAIQNDDVNVTVIGLEKLTLQQNSKDTNLKFSVKLKEEENISKMNVKVEYYDANNVLRKDKTNEFIVEDSSILHLTDKNSIDTHGLKDGDYHVAITIEVNEVQKIIKVPLKVVPKFKEIKLKVENKFEKDYSVNETQPVIIPVTVYGVNADKTEYQINDELLEIEANFMNHMNLKLWNNRGTYYLTLNVQDLEMAPGEYEVKLHAKKYTDSKKESIQYEVKSSTTLSIIKGIKSIDFDTDKVEIEKGKEKKIELQITPSDAIRNDIQWISNNKDIATVKDGLINGINIGSTIVTAMIGDKKAEILVIVKPVIHIDDMNIKDVIDSLADQNQININFETKNNLMINEEILAALDHNREKELSILVKDNEKSKYSWTFHGTDITKDEFSNIALQIETSLEAPNSVKENMKEEIKEDVMYINFKHEGEIPCDVDIGIYVGDKFKVNDKVRLYYYNLENNKLEFRHKDLEVNKEGMISFSIDHCSTYVISKKALLHENGNRIVFSVITVLCILVIFFCIYFVRKKKKRSYDHYYNHR